MRLPYAIRVLRKSRGTALVAILTLALGIGANTAIFSVFHAVLLSPLPYRDADGLVSVLLKGSDPLGSADFLDIQRQSQSFESSGAAELWSASLEGRGAPEQIVGMHVTRDLFHVLDVAPVRGRTFDTGDFTPGKDHVVVIGYGLWQRQFGGAPDIAGRQVLLDNSPYTIIGVMPRGFYFAPFWVTQAEMWAPADLTASLSQRGGGSLRMFARLAPGTGRAAARTEMNLIAARLAAAYPDADAGMTLEVESLADKATGNVRPLLEVLLAVAGMVLLIACANVANLALARATARQKEIAVRLALGATRMRIAGQCLAESVVLSLAGGAAGVLLAQLGIAALEAMLRPDAGEFRARLQQWDRLGLDMPVLLFALGVSIATGILFGLAPAFAAARGETNEALKEGGRGSTPGRGSRVRRALVSAQIAVALALLIGAGLLTRSFHRLRSIDPGFDAHNVVAMTVSVAGRTEYTGARRDALYRAVIGRAAAVPGVESASMTNHLPIAGDQWGYSYWIERQAPPPRGREFTAVYRSCRPGYFATMRTRIIAGRDFDDRDTADAPPVVIINEALARRHFGRTSAVGQRISFRDPRKAPRWMTVVGVIQDMAQSWAEAPGPEVYTPYWQDPLLTGEGKPFAAYMTLVARTRGDAASLLEAVKNAVWSVDRTLPLAHAQTLEHAIGGATWQSSFALLLVTVFSGLALALAAVGVYGVVAYEVEQRRHEIGVRMALGAGAGGVARLIAGQNLPSALAGIAAGLGGAAGLVRLMRSMLYQVDALDPVTFAGAALFLLLVAAAAAAVPARRAMRVDPMTALR